MANDKSPADTTPRRMRSPWNHPYYILFILFLLWMLSFLDRQMLGLLVTPIRSDLGLSDFQISLLQGFSFALFYGCAGLPIGWMVDRFPRRPIFYAGITIWGLAATGCGLATTFTQLFVARMFVGVGEAALSPAGYSLLADVFPRTRLSFAISVAAMGGALGSGLAFALGGFILELGHSGALDYPVLGDFEPWQQVFILTGLPGLLIGFLVFTFPEPQRRSYRENTAGVRANNEDASMRAFVSYLRCYPRFYTCHILGFTSFSIANYGFQAWAAEYMRREFGWSSVEIGLTFGTALSIAVIAAYFLGGLLVDRLFSRGMRDAHLRVFFWFAVACIPLSIWTLLTPDPWVFLVVSTIWGIFSISFGGAAAAALQITTPPQFRGRVSSLYLVVVVLLGMSVGPSSIAALTQFVLGEDSYLGTSMLIVMMIVYPLGAAMFAAGMKPMRDRIDEIDGMTTHVT